MPTRPEAESLVRSWGFPHVFAWTDGQYIPPSPKRALSPAFPQRPNDTPDPPR
ncbi:MAG: hypothetical protein Q9188_003051 [Gyalolechia gomerana]